MCVDYSQLEKMLLVTDKERKKGVIGLTNIGFIRFIEENHGFTPMWSETSKWGYDVKGYDESEKETNK